MIGCDYFLIVFRCVCAQYLARVRRYVHVVVCVSPYGESFRTRLRQYPSLTSCTTIDWFSEWPADALTAVATAVLTSRQQEEGRSGAMTPQLPPVVGLTTSVGRDIGAHALPAVIQVPPAYPPVCVCVCVWVCVILPRCHPIPRVHECLFARGVVALFLICFPVLMLSKLPLHPAVCSS